MIIVNKDQKWALDAEAENRFVGDITREMVSDYPEMFSASRPREAELAARRAIAVARRQGLTQENAITVFVHLMCAISSRFFEHPAIAQALAEPEAMTADERMMTIMRRVPAQAWEEAEAELDMSLLFNEPDQAFTQR